MNKSDVIKFNKNNVYTGLSKNGCGRTYFAKRGFKTGEKLICGYGKIVDHQTPHISVQIKKNKHYLPEKWTGKYWNHSCNPNACVKTRSDGFPDWYAMRDIKEDEELNFPYWKTEYEWSKQADEYRISCKCGHKNCRKKIFSFSQLSKNEQVEEIEKGLCSKYLASMLSIIGNEI